MNQDKNKVILTYTLENSNGYPNKELDNNTFQYCGDKDKRNQHGIKIALPLYGRKKNNSPFTFKGNITSVVRYDVIKHENKTIDVFRLTLHPTEKSLGGLSPGDEVPNSNSEKVIHKKDGTIWEKSYGRGSMRYIRDCCIDSNIKKLESSPARAIIFGE